MCNGMGNNDSDFQATPCHEHASVPEAASPAQPHGIHIHMIYTSIRQSLTATMVVLAGPIVGWCDISTGCDSGGCGEVAWCSRDHLYRDTHSASHRDGTGVAGQHLP